MVYDDCHSTFFNTHHLPKGVFLFADGGSVFYDWSYQPIVRCMGHWPDHVRASGEPCDPANWNWYYDHALRDIEFYEDTLDAKRVVLHCHETTVLHRELLESTPALEIEIRRRDDAERIPAEAAQRASVKRYEERCEQERLRRLAMTPQERETEDAACVARITQAFRRAVPKASAPKQPPSTFQLQPGTPIPSATIQSIEPQPPRQGFGGYAAPLRGNSRKRY